MPVKTFFTGIQNTILSYLRNAEDEIIVAVAWLTNKVLFDELCEKAKFGTTVRIVILRDKINLNSACNYEILLINGAEFFWQDQLNNSLMHHKFCVIDRKTVITGSYNWTNKASLNNENITILEEEPEAAKSYIDEFRSIVPLFEEVNFVETNYVSNRHLNTSEKRLDWYNSLSEKWKKNLNVDWIGWENEGASGAYRMEYSSLDERISEMLRLKDVSLTGDVSELSGLIHLSDLEVLNINNNSANIRDLSPLRNLINLRKLRISANEISDISQLKNLKKLRVLEISSTKLKDVSHIKELKKITNLAFTNCDINDITCTSKMYDLKILNINNNKVENINSLGDKIHLERLEFDKNEVQNISILGECKRLSRISMNWNKIKDISPLKDCTNLKMIYANNNEIEDILSLVNLKRLQYFSCSINPLKNDNFDLFRRASKAYVY